jgi:IclR family acetate operon transcriptional repressor
MADAPAALPGRTASTITSHAALEAHLERIREQGYAFDDEENDIHTRCISAPVFGPGGGPLGCIGIDAPSVRLTIDHVPEAAAIVVEVARRLSVALSTARSA